MIQLCYRNLVPSPFRRVLGCGAYICGCVVRKIWTILALACLLFLTGGYHLLYQCRLAEVKAAVKENLKTARRSELTPLAFSAAEIQTLVWEEASEFCYRDKMYDVVDVETKDGQTIYWCLADEKETALLDAYLQTHNPSSDKNPSCSLIKLLQAPFLPVVFQWNKTAIPDNGKPFSFYSLSPSLSKAAVLTPPPKAC